MSLSTKFQHNRRKLYIWSVFTLTGGLIGIIYSLMVGGNPKIAFPIGCALTGGVIGFELLYVQQSAGAWLRGLPLPGFIALSTLVWVVIIALSLQVVPRLLGLGKSYGQEYTAITFQ